MVPRVHTVSTSLLSFLAHVSSSVVLSFTQTPFRFGGSGATYQQRRHQHGGQQQHWRQNQQQPAAIQDLGAMGSVAFQSAFTAGYAASSQSPNQLAAAAITPQRLQKCTSPGACFNCNTFGHFASSCPKPPQNK